MQYPRAVVIHLFYCKKNGARYDGGMVLYEDGNFPGSWAEPAQPKKPVDDGSHFMSGIEDDPNFYMPVTAQELPAKLDDELLGENGRVERSCRIVMKLPGCEYKQAKKLTHELVSIFDPEGNSSDMFINVGENYRPSISLTMGHKRWADVKMRERLLQGLQSLRGRGLEPSITICPFSKSQKIERGILDTAQATNEVLKSKVVEGTATSEQAFLAGAGPEGYIPPHLTGPGSIGFDEVAELEGPDFEVFKKR